MLIGTREGLVCLALMVAWLVVPLIRDPRDAQDAIPLVVAGELVVSRPEAVYVPVSGGLFDLHPDFRERSCEIMADQLDCEEFAVAFVSPPPALPIVRILSLVGPWAGALLTRMTAALAMTLGMVLLWARLAPTDPRAPAVLSLAAAAVTPHTLIVTGLGQTSAFMFAAAAMIPCLWDRPGIRRFLFVAVMVLVAVFKATPVVVLLVPLLSRRWRLLVYCASAVLCLGVLAVVLAGGTEIMEGYRDASEAISRQASVNPYNGSADAFAFRLLGSEEASEALRVGTLVRFAVVAVLVLSLARMRQESSRWALFWSAVPLLAPLAWWHYTVASAAAMGVALGDGRSGRKLWAWPATLSAGIPLGIANNRGYSYPEAQFLWAAAAFAVTLWLGLSAQRPRTHGGASGESREKSTEG
ncbi:MAG: hypothetical protein KatS3mg008_1254 [Acidimicrobiales bacterium]|nr:MAG: hypothetical protein KatS3mg008_1254 [Acidimicrobiales bacterium]